MAHVQFETMAPGKNTALVQIQQTGQQGVLNGSNVISETFLVDTDQLKRLQRFGPILVAIFLFSPLGRSLRKPWNCICEVIRDWLLLSGTSIIHTSISGRKTEIAEIVGLARGCSPHTQTRDGAFWRYSTPVSDSCSCRTKWSLFGQRLP